MGKPRATFERYMGQALSNPLFAGPFLEFLKCGKAGRWLASILSTQVRVPGNEQKVRVGALKLKPSVIVLAEILRPKVCAHIV